VRPAAVLAVALLWLGVLSQSGCASGGVALLARRAERVAEFEAAYSDGEQLWVVYRSAILDHDGREVGTRRRAARLRLDDLEPSAFHPVDAFPLVRLHPDEVPRSATSALALLEANDRSSELADPGGPLARIARNGERHTGLRLERVPGAAPGALLRADSLGEQRLAGWAWPLLPLAAAGDMVTTPPLVLLGLTLFSWDP
jgi:hypothetical protein